MGVMCLQYVDDTLLFLGKDLKVAVNMKWMLTCFELISGMSINYHRSEIVLVNFEEGEIDSLLGILQCIAGSFPIKYLGLPLYFEILHREDLQSLLDKMLARIVGWRGKLLSYIGKITLIRSCLASIPIYMLPFFKFPEMSNCLWSDSEGKDKVHLANCSSICMKKEFGGKEIPNL